MNFNKIEDLMLIPEGSVVGIDTETTGLNPLYNTVRLVTLAYKKGDEYKTLIFDTMLDENNYCSIIRVLSRLKVKYVWHNALFDLSFVFFRCGSFNYFKNISLTDADVFNIVKKSFCTMIATQLVLGTTEKVSLEEACKIFLNIKINKEEQKSDWSNTVLTLNQLKYAIDDSVYALRVYEHIIEKEVSDKGICKSKGYSPNKDNPYNLIHLFDNVEMPAMLGSLYMKTCGVHIDTGIWVQAYEASLEEYNRISREYAEALGVKFYFDMLGEIYFENNFNLNSSQQLIGKLNSLGCILPKNNEGNYTLNKKEIEKHINLLEKNKKYYTIGKQNAVNFSIDILRKHLEFSNFSTQVKNYSPKWFEFIDSTTGKIHADWQQIGTETGRFTCNKPALQNIPKKGGYREAVTGGENRTLVSADYSQVEVYIAAIASGDESMLCSLQKEDFHRETAAKINNIEPDKVTKEQRQNAKQATFGILFGQNPVQYAAKNRTTEEFAVTQFENYAKSYPRLMDWLNERGNQAKNEGWSFTTQGRRRRFKQSKLHWEQEEAYRQGCNAPVQGTSADITKIALYLIVEKIFNKGLVNKIQLHISVHDEIVLSSDDSSLEECKTILKESMEEAFSIVLPGHKTNVEVGTGKSWQESK